MYKMQKFQIRSVEEVMEDIDKAKRFTEKLKEVSWRYGFGGDLQPLAERYEIHWLISGCVKTAFIGDSDSPIMKQDQLAQIIEYLRKTFPTIERVTSYARAKTIIRKSSEYLKNLSDAGLTRIHMGLETGDDKLLRYIGKGATADEMVEAGLKVKDAGISLSEYVILGLGGKKWREHAVNTAEVLNRINPYFIRVRTLFLIPTTPLFEKAQTGDFVMSSPKELLMEEKLLIENLNVDSYFVSDHVSNILNIEGKMPEDKEKMLSLIDTALLSGACEEFRRVN
jgi:radical SAM superfamily enzyme YgiQ (UPF0313 family)